MDVAGLTHLSLDTRLDAEQGKHLRTIHTAGEVLLTLLNGILNSAKLENGGGAGGVFSGRGKKLKEVLAQPLVARFAVVAGVPEQVDGHVG